MSALKSTIFSISLFFSIYSYSQNKIYKEIYNYNTKTSPPSPAPDNIANFINNGILYYVGSTAGHDNTVLLIYAYDLKTQKSKTISVKKSKETKQIFNQEISAIAFLKNKLIILNYLSIYILEREKDLEYTLKKTIRNDGSFSEILPLTENELLFYVNYNFHPQDETETHTWAKLYIDHDSLGAEKRMEDNNLLFTPMLNSWISTYKGLIAYASTVDYTIKFYNENFNMIDSLKTNEFDKNKVKLALLPNGLSYSLDEINKIQQGDDTLLTRIQKIFMLDSNHIMVTIKQPRTHHLRYDIWHKKELKWELFKSQDLPGHYEDKSKYTNENNYITGFYGGFTGLRYSNNKEFYFIYYPFIENPLSNSFDYQKDYYDIINEMTRKKNLHYGIKKLKILSE